MTHGQRIAACRRAVGLTQVELARRIGITQSQLCRIEQGRYRVTAERLEVIAAELGIPVGALYAEAA
jgi:transcriptional regulator with XRE-family HTH domain